jgi:hypothetical protein
MLLYTMHAPQDAHLAEVIAAMRTLGAPTLRVVDCGDHYVALEGMHRLAACAELGMAPELVVLEHDDLVEGASLDLHHVWPDETYSAGELAGELWHMDMGCYRIDDDGTLSLVSQATV